MLGRLLVAIRQSVNSNIMKKYNEIEDFYTPSLRLSRKNNHRFVWWVAGLWTLVVITHAIVTYVVYVSQYFLSIA